MNLLLYHGRSPTWNLDWWETVFTAPQLASPEISDPDTDFDKDGLSFLLEYAIGSDPIQAAVGLGVLMVKESVAGQRLSVEVSHLQQVGLVGLRHSLEISRNLIHWSADSPNFFGGSQQPAQDGFVKATFTYAAPSDSEATFSGFGSLLQSELWVWPELPEFRNHGTAKSLVKILEEGDNSLDPHEKT